MKALFATILCCIVVSGCCGDEIVSEVRSPDGLWTAKRRERDCGATTPVYTHILLSGPGHTDELVMSIKYVPSLLITWKDNRTLVIDCSTCMEGEGNIASGVGDIKIDFRPFINPHLKKKL
jgi:hypothetical protein